MSKAAAERKYHSSKRVECPSCGARALAPLVTPAGTDESRGYCFLCSSPVGFPAERTTHAMHESERTAQLLEWHGKTTSESLRHRNGLSTYLVDRYGDAARAVLEAWDVGTDGQGNCVFWYRDETGHLATAKVVPYDSSTGKRRKRDLSPIAWTVDGKQVRVDCLFGLVKGTNKETQEAVVVSFSSRKGYTAPLYGAQFLTADTVDRPVVLVESEKTAIVGSLFLPEFLFVATGGANGLTRDKAQPLAGRDVLVLLDADNAGRRSEESVSNVLESVGARPILEVDGVPLVAALMPDAEDGADLADYYLQRELEEQVDTLTAAVETWSPPAVEDWSTPDFSDMLKYPDLSDWSTPSVTFPTANVVEEFSSRQLKDKQFVYTLMLRVYRGDKRLRFEELNKRAVEMFGEQSSDVLTRADEHRLYKKHFDWSQLATTKQCIEFRSLVHGGKDE